MDRANVLHAEHLVKTFGRGENVVRAVDDVSLDVGGGELVVVMGPSGSGKTTLLSMLGALLTPDEGHITIDGTDVGGLDANGLAALRGRSIGFVFQAFNLLEALSVTENVLFPAQLAPGGVAAARPRAAALLERLNLEHRAHARPGTLSGGEQQRVAIARALVNEPRLVLADEPTGNLDSHSGQKVMMIFRDVARDRGCGVVLVTHDPRVLDVADRVLWLEDGTLSGRRADEREWLRDPVCGMRVDAWTATLFSEHEGRRYAFCSARCQARFDAEPARFARGAGALDP